MMVMRGVPRVLPLADAEVNAESPRFVQGGNQALGRFPTSVSLLHDQPACPVADSVAALKLLPRPIALSDTLQGLFCAAGSK